MFINCLSISFISFITGILALFLCKKLALKYGLFVLKGILLVGGISIALAFIFGSLSGCFLFHLPLKAIIGIVFSSAIMLVFGLFDDQKELSIKTKLLIQIIAASVLILFGIRTKVIYIGDLANIIITLIWIIGITNAFNHLDVIDGLAGGAAIITGSAFFVIALLNADKLTAILSLALVTAVFSFLLFNFPPAKIYMGNSGSHFLGFVLGAIALLISYAPLGRKAALFTPLLILGFPIIDTAMLILLRVGKKRIPFKKSNDHLALRFLAMGYSKKKALLVMLACGLFFTICGILVSQTPNILGIAIILLAVLASLILFKKMSKVEVHG